MIGLTMVADRIGVGPISWGVCEVPGWGVMLDADRVLAEMASLGIGARRSSARRGSCHVIRRRCAPCSTATARG